MVHPESALPSGTPVAPGSRPNCSLTSSWTIEAMAWFWGREFPVQMTTKEVMVETLLTRMATMLSALRPSAALTMQLTRAASSSSSGLSLMLSRSPTSSSEVTSLSMKSSILLFFWYRLRSSRRCWLVRPPIWSAVSLYPDVVAVAVAVAAVLLVKNFFHAKELLRNARNRNRPIDSRVWEFVLEDGTPELRPGERKISVHQQPRNLERIVVVVAVVAKVDQARKVGGEKRKHAAVSHRSKEFLPRFKRRLKVGRSGRKYLSVRQDHPGPRCIVVVVVVLLLRGATSSAVAIVGAALLQKVKLGIPHQRLQLVLQQRKKIPAGTFSGFQTAVRNRNGSFQPCAGIDAAADGHAGDRTGRGTSHHRFRRIQKFLVDETLRNAHVIGQEQSARREGKTNAAAAVAVAVAASIAAASR
mmetsp:Transcript_20932/g.49368  ORF Transcript_20932/g.49368 Transcript_20932/m.49368 type:complete len:415 (-) Transcript_20932:148-1392(-)